MVSKISPALDIALHKKLGALSLLAQHVGLVSPRKQLRPRTEELNLRRQAYGEDIVIACVFVLQSSDKLPIQKAAAGLLLECFAPGWRDYAPPDLVGQVVRRDSKEVFLWRKLVLKRDGYKCQSCGSRKKLHAHHIVRWSEEPRLRTVVENGITLCKQCHDAEHGKPRA